MLAMCWQAGCWRTSGAGERQLRGVDAPVSLALKPVLLAAAPKMGSGAPAPVHEIVAVPVAAAPTPAEFTLVAAQP
jgi:hypothetical protein